MILRIGRKSMTHDYSQRIIASSYIDNIASFTDPEGETVTVSVAINLAGIDKNPQGPNVRIVLSFPLKPEDTIQSVKHEALKRAISVLSRISQETPESLCKIPIPKG
jgi:hypothetical protein